MNDIFFLVYVPHKRILWKGTEKFIDKLKASTGYTHSEYKKMTRQGIREMEWDF